MNKYFYKLFILLATIIMSMLLVSCAGMYSEPSANTVPPPATIQGTSKRDSLVNWQTLAIKAIDSKEIVGMSMFPTSKWRVTPESHLITVQAMYNRALFSSGPYETYIDIRANFLPGQHYWLNSHISGSTVQVWIEDAKGRQISRAVSNSVHSYELR